MTDNSHIYEQVVASIKQLALEQGHEIGSVPEHFEIARDLGISSIDLLHLLVDLEGRLGVSLSLDELDLCAQFGSNLTVADLVLYVGRKQTEAANQEVH